MERRESYWQIATRELTKAITEIEVEGRENIPERPPYIVASNHMSGIDPPVLEIAIEKKIIWMTKAENFTDYFGYFGLFSRFNTFSVARGTPDRSALNEAVKLLSQGEVVGILPEGTRGRDRFGNVDRLKPFRGGIVYVATRADVPILPIGIKGTEEVFRDLIKGNFLFPEIKVRIGEPFHLEPVEGRMTKREREERLGVVRQRISELLPQKYLAQNPSARIEMAMGLASKKCVPCEGGTPPFSKEEVEKYLAQTPGWELVKDEKRRLKIQREFKFATYLQGAAFIQKIARIAEDQDHHPEIFLGWRRARVEFFTHAIGGLSENDFIMAAKINRLAPAPDRGGKKDKPRSKRN